MFDTYQVNYLNLQHQKLRRFSKKFDECEILEVTNIPSNDKALELISSPWLKNDVIALDSLFGLHLKIDEKIDENFDEKFRKNKIERNLSLLVCFEWMNEEYESRIYWSVCDSIDDFRLDVFDEADGKLTNFCKEFIIEEIKMGRKGILKHFQCDKKNIFKLQELGNESGSNLLLIATQQKNTEIVQKLLQTGFHVDSEDINGLTAIDHAWLNFINESHHHRDKTKKIILCLLRANSRYPSKKVDFDHKKLSSEARMFLEMSESFHKMVSDEKIEELNVKLEVEPNLVHFYDKNNQSLLMHAMKLGRPKHICNRLTIGYHEELEGTENLTKRHILILKSKSKVSSSQINSQKCWTFIDEVFKYLDADQTSSKILKATSIWKCLKICFDFSKDTTYYSCTSLPKFTQATAFESGCIYIGAKNFMNNNKKLDIISALIHELCHVAVLIAFSNDSNPFSAGNSGTKNKFEEQIVVKCRENQKCEKVIENIFNLPKELHNVELITAVVDLHFQNKFEFQELFNYFENVVMCKLEEAIPMIRLLQDGTIDVKYDDLSKSMKVRISRAEIIFQGETTSFFDLFGYNPDVLRLLSSKDIRNCLIKGQKIRISEAPQVTNKSELIRRKYIDAKLELSQNIKDEEINVNRNVRNYMQVRNETIFMLAENCSNSRFATFEELLLKLNKFFKDFWILCVRVKNFDEPTEMLEKNPKISDCFKFLSSLADFSTSIEATIFEKMFYSNKVIFMLDGIDEVSPKFFEFIIKVLKVINKEMKNRLWISFGTQNIRRLEELFSTKAYKPIVTIYRKEMRKIIEKRLKTLGFKNAKNRNVKAQEVLTIINRIKEELLHLCTIDKESMIQIITELFVDSKVDKNFSSIYEVFDRMIKKQCQNVDIGSKGPMSGQVMAKFHQAKALKLIIGDKYEDVLGFKIESLGIMKHLDKDKQKVTTEKFMRYGFLAFDPENKTQLEFIHRTYAEFFIAQFIFSYLLSSESKESEFEKIFKILTVLRENFQISRIFLLSFMRNKPKILKIQTKARTFVMMEALALIKDDFATLNLNSLEFWSIFLNNDANNLKILWQVTEKNDLLTKFITSDLIKSSDEYKKFIDLIEFCFSDNWHEMFNKNAYILVSSDGTEKFDEKLDKNFIKLLSFVEENLKIDEQKIFFDKIFELKILKFLDLRILNKILTKICDVFEDDRTNFVNKIIKFAEFYAFKSSNEEGLKYFGMKLEEILLNDRQDIRQVLFYEYRPEFHPLVNAIKFEDVKNFRLYKNLYKKYKNSYSELMNIFIAYSIVFENVSFINDQIYPEFEAFFKEIFDSDRMRFKEYINRYFKTGTRLLVRQDAFKYILKLLKYVFGDSKVDFDKISTKFTIFTDFILKLS